MRIKSGKDYRLCIGRPICSLFFGCCCCSRVLSFSFGRKVHVGEPAAAEFLLSKRVFFVFWSTHREKKRCVCVVVKPASFQSRDEKEDAPKQTSAFCLEKERRTCNNRETTGSFKVLECVHDYERLRRSCIIQTLSSKDGIVGKKRRETRRHIKKSPKEENGASSSFVKRGVTLSRSARRWFLSRRFLGRSFFRRARAALVLFCFSFSICVRSNSRWI